MKNSSIIYDSSYYGGIIIYDIDFIRTCLQSMPKKNFSIYTHFSFQGELICPVEVFHSENSVILIIHPSAYGQIIQIFTNNNIKFIDIKDQLSIFRLRGAKSTEIINNSLNIQDSKIKRLLASISLFHNFKLSNGAIISINFLKTLNKQNPSKSDTLKNTSEVIIPVQPSDDLFDIIINWPDYFYNPQFWSQFNEQKQMISHAPDKLTTRSARSRYPSIKNKLPKEEVIKEDEGKGVEKMEKCDMELDEVIVEDEGVRVLGC